MKKQRQNVRSIRVKEVLTSESNDSPTKAQKKEHNVYIRIFNAEETVHTDQTGPSQFKQWEQVHHSTGRNRW
jgi:hypothetical protein